MLNDTAIRKMTPGDIPAVAPMLKALHKLHTSSRPDIYAQADDSLFERRAADIAANADYIALLAEIDGAAVGIALVSLKESTNPLCNRRRIAFIEAIYVVESMRLRGVGSKLYNAALEQAKESGSDSLELSVCSFNSGALDFYISMGMKSKSALLEMKL